MKVWIKAWIDCGHDDDYEYLELDVKSLDQLEEHAQQVLLDLLANRIDSGWEEISKEEFEREVEG
ncbi:MAG: hypothetical protein GY871_04585 [Actinomycetales bacterium]|nr:hypothetical protein [Actinomycetales bacterium]